MILDLISESLKKVHEILEGLKK